MKEGKLVEKYILSCCSTADLTQEHFEKRNISYICFHYELDGKEYIDDLGCSLSYNEFYSKLKEGASTKTSQVNAEEFENYFEPYLKKGLDILHVCLSSGLSGVINSANIARINLLERFPERKICIIDSLGASSGYGLIMDHLADLRDEGKTIEELQLWVDENKLRLHHWFFSSDLSFYIKGGRISKTEGTIGNILNICPLLNMNAEGRLIPRYKIHSKKKAIKAIVNKMVENATDGSQYSGKCYISHSYCYDDARQVADLVESIFENLSGPVEIYDVGTTIGSHTGPGTVALFFWGNERNN